jgi:hypothetical protein
MGKSESCDAGSCPNMEMPEVRNRKKSHARIPRKISAVCSTEATDFIHHSFTMNVI